MKMLMNRIAVVVTIAMAMASCTFPNDMSYPIVPGEIVAFDVEGAESVTIDNENRTVSIVLDELCDISALKVEAFVCSEKTQVIGGIPSVIDLSVPKTFILETYQEYEWTVSAVQPIERYINVVNQASDPELNLSTRIAVVYVTDSQPLDEITFNSMKLEREGTRLLSTTGFELVDGESIETTLPVEFPMTLNCTMLRYFDYLSGDEEIRWTVKVVQEKVELKIASVNAWAKRAQIYALFDGTGTPVLEYRKASEDMWTEVMNATISGVGISADIAGLDPASEYEVRVCKDGKYSSAYSFATEEDAQLYNFSFDEWHLDGKIWYPYPSGASPQQKVWDSANKGAATFIGSSTAPDELDCIEGYSVKMESKYAVIAFAAGNLYTGAFDKIAGIGAELDWGTPFESRPSALKGWYKYAPKPIDRAKAPYENMIGQMDKCQIQVLLTDWDKPFHINTTTGKFVDVAGDPAIIAHGILESDEATDGFVEFTIPLEYRNLERKPKYVVVSACASSLGDYFTGGVGSVLHVDEFEFLYD